MKTILHILCLLITIHVNTEHVYDNDFEVKQALKRPVWTIQIVNPTVFLPKFK